MVEETGEIEVYKGDMYLATVTQKQSFAIIDKIKEALTEQQWELFIDSPFKWWIDVQATSGDGQYVHLGMLHEVRRTVIRNDDTLWYMFGGQLYQFGRREFCLITGLRFGPVPHLASKGRSRLARRLFKGVTMKISDAEIQMTNAKFMGQLDDLDAVKFAWVMLLVRCIAGLDPSTKIPPMLLKLVDDVGVWNAFPWGNYVWERTHDQLRHRLWSLDHHIEKREKNEAVKITLTGCTWAFKIWVWETFREHMDEAHINRHDIAPRVVRWARSKRASWNAVKAVIIGQQGREMNPTRAEAASEWFKPSIPFFKGDLGKIDDKDESDGDGGYDDDDDDRDDGYIGRPSPQARKSSPHPR